MFFQVLATKDHNMALGGVNIPRILMILVSLESPETQVPSNTIISKTRLIRIDPALGYIMI